MYPPVSKRKETFAYYFHHVFLQNSLIPNWNDQNGPFAGELSSQICRSARTFDARMQMTFHQICFGVAVASIT